MGQMASNPVELIRVQRSRGKKWRAAVAEMQGWRAEHEDAHFMKDGSCPVFGVLDGHGGSKCARLSAGRLPQPLGKACESGAGQEKVNGTFVETDEWLRGKLIGGDTSGTTCVTAFMQPAGKEGFKCGIMNAGDSRGVLVQRGEPCKRVESDDHKPSREDEHKRIYAAGGHVSDQGGEVPRVDGVLAVSRGLGDFTYKKEGGEPAEQKVSCIPEIYPLILQAGDFIILACDGIFDVMSTETLVETILSRRRENPKLDLGDLASDVLLKCLSADSKDNMTLMIIEVGVENGPGLDLDRPHEIKGLNKVSELKDDAQKKSYAAFLEYCAESEALPADAQEVHDTLSRPKPVPAGQLTTQERLQAKRNQREQQRNKQKTTAVPLSNTQTDDIDLDALADFIEGKAGKPKPKAAPKEKASPAKETPAPKAKAKAAPKAAPKEPEAVEKSPPKAKAKAKPAPLKGGYPPEPEDLCPLSPMSNDGILTGANQPAAKKKNKKKKK